ETPLRFVDRNEDTACGKEAALSSRLHDDVGHEPGEQHIVCSNGEQHEVERALRAVTPGRCHQLGQLGDLGAVYPWTRDAGSRPGTLEYAQRPEKSDIDGRAGAAKRNEGDREVRVLNCKRERGAHLITVQRAMTGAAQPARTFSRPRARSGIFGYPAAALVSPETGAARPEILIPIEAFEAEALVGKPDRAIRIAFAGSQRVSHACDE